MNASIRRYRPREADSIRRMGRYALGEAIGCAKKGADALGVSRRMVTYWLAGEKTSPVDHALEMIASVENPYPLVAVARTAAMQKLITMTDEQLIAAFHEANRDETRAQGQMDEMQIARGYGRTAEQSLAEIEMRALREAADAERIAAIAAELRRRNINPWRDA